MPDPSAAVDSLIGISKNLGPEQFEDIYELLLAEGIDRDLANATVNMCQLVFGRAVLGGLSIQLSDRYVRFDVNGTVVEEGKLSENPIYIAAEKVSPIALKMKVLVNLAMGSSEVHAVNDLLNNGSDPEDVATAPFAYFDAPPTHAGMNKARDFLTKVMQELYEQTKKDKGKNKSHKQENAVPESAQNKAKPWWRLW